jgi:hypothetical protein
VFRRHAVELHDLSESEGAAFMRDIQRLSAALHLVTGAAKLNYEVHGNTIRHLHMHFYPRHPGDGLSGWTDSSESCDWAGVWAWGGCGVSGAIAGGVECLIGGFVNDVITETSRFVDRERGAAELQAKRHDPVRPQRVGEAGSENLRRGTDGEAGAGAQAALQSSCLGIEVLSVRLLETVRS